MTKVSKRLLALLLITMTLAISLFVWALETTTKRELKARTMNELNLAALAETQSFEENLKQTEVVTKELKRLVRGSFDLKMFQKDPQYMKAYLEILDPQIKKIAEEAAINHSAYVYFLPEMTESSLSIWYADLTGAGRIERQPPFDISYFDGNKPEKQWFYGPILTQKGFWTEPYRGSIAADRDIIYFSYTEPVIVDGRTIAVVGNDFYFNKAKERIEAFKLNGKGYAFLMDQNDKILTHPTVNAGVDMKYYQGGKYAPIMNKIKASHEGDLAYSWENDQNKIMFYHHLNNGWVLVFTITEIEMYSELLQIEGYKWALIGVILVGVFGLGRLFLKPLDQALHWVNQVSRELATGFYNMSMPLHYLQKSDELGKVIQNFETVRIEMLRLSQTHHSEQNEMDKQLSAKQDEIQKMNDYLELSLQQLQEKNGEMNIVIEKYEDQKNRNQILLEHLMTAEQVASKVYLLGALMEDILSPIGNSVTLATYLRTEKEQILKMMAENNLRKNNLNDFLNVLGESLELIDRNMNMANKNITQLGNLIMQENRQSEVSFGVKETLTSLFQAIVARSDQKLMKLNLSGENYSIKSNQRAFIQLFSHLLMFSLVHTYEGQTRGVIHIKIEQTDEKTLQIIYEDFGKSTPPFLIERAIGMPLSAMLESEPIPMSMLIVSNLLQKEFEGVLKFEKGTSQGHKFIFNMKVGVIS